MTTRLPTLLAALTLLPTAVAADKPLEQAPNTWVKRSPLKGGPPSPGMGYECALAYDPIGRKVIRWGGHNQGGGGEQNAETWVYDPATGRWELREPNTSPPGVCCAQQFVFDTLGGRFLRFPAFSGSHGWQWFREIYLSNSTAWSYDPAKNVWRDLRPLPAPRVAPLRCASWDSDHGVAVVFGGEGSNEGTLVYDPYTNVWTRMSPKVQPAGRSGGNMAYDAARKVHVLFGTQFGDDPRTWTYDLLRNEWRDMKPAVQPPTDRNDAVLAYDPANRVVIACVRVVDKGLKDEIVAAHLETWAYEVGKNTWAAMKPEREPDGWGNRRRVMVAVPDQNVVLMEAFVNPTEKVPGVDREQQIWTYRYAEPPADAPPQPPGRLRVQTEADSSVLTWDASPSPGVTGYAVYRGEKADRKRIWLTDAKATRFLDAGLEYGKVVHYAVRAVGRDGKEGDAVLGRTQPRIIDHAVVSVAGPREVRITWAKPPDADDVVGYHVERAIVEVFSEDQVIRLKKDTPPLAEPSVGAVKVIGPFGRLTREPVKVPAYTDTDLDLTKPDAVKGDAVYTHRFRDDQLDKIGKPYRFAVFAYRVRAVNALGVEGGPSPFFLTIPSAPQGLFSREEGEKCHLKWDVSPEGNRKGFRVYRMESPRINGPGQPVTRLTNDPIAEPKFIDEKAGKDTRRYWVVAVDALGQEGFPSAPTWHQRQYRKYYEPFVGEWHQ